jgi:tetratricopeptide (TPR) repeat protein
LFYALLFALFSYNYIFLGLPDLALATLEEATRLTKNIGAHQNKAYSQLNLGLAYVRLGDNKLAQNILEQALTEMEAFGDLFGQASGNLYLGLGSEETGAHLVALGRFKQARAFFTKAGTTGFANDARSGLARCLLAMGDLDGAYQEVNPIWEYLTETGSRGLEFPGLAYLTCARVYEALDLVDQTMAAVTAGYADLMERAERIEDDAWRQSFLYQIEEHQALVERWKALV